MDVRGSSGWRLAWAWHLCLCLPIFRLEKGGAAALEGRLAGQVPAGGEGALRSWLMTALPQNTLMQELESSQRQIEEQHHHKVPAACPLPPSRGGRGCAGCSCSGAGTVSPLAARWGELTDPPWSLPHRCLTPACKEEPEAIA